MSSIDATKPTAGTALTSDVRSNFAIAKSEIEALGNGSSQYAAAGGTVDAITISLVHTITSYTDGLQVNVRAAGANATTTPTLNIDSVGAKTITKIGNEALRVGDIPKADYECIFRYNSTNDVFELLNPALYPPLSGETGVTNYEYPYGNVHRYGAVGDGATDDTTAIQASVDSGIARIYFDPDKTYFLNTATADANFGVYGTGKNRAIEVPANTIVDGKGCTIKTNQGSTNIWAFIVPNDNCEIINFNFTADSEPTVKSLYGGGAIAVTGDNCTVGDMNIAQHQHGILGFNAIELKVKNNIAYNTAGEMGAHFALYSCKKSSIDYCTSYQGTGDGNIGLFGTSENCNVTNCCLYNYPLGSTPASTTLTTAQGIFVDSGVYKSLVANNTVRGFYYCIDVKTNTFGVVVADNIVEASKVGIAVRLGEGNDTVLAINITGNTIIMNNDTAASTTLDTTLSGDITLVKAAIYVQNTTCGVNIAGNTIMADVDTDATVDGCGILYINTVNSDDSKLGPVNISGNIFTHESRIGANYGLLRGPSIKISSDTNYGARSINITGNSFDPPYVSYSATTEYSVIEVDYAQDVTINGNTFTHFQADMIIRVENSKRITIDGNSTNITYGFLKATSTDTITANGNSILSSISLVPFFDFDTVNYVSINGNVVTSSASTNGVFINGVTTDYVIYNNNVVKTGNASPITLANISGANVKATDNYSV